jgi:hypothetical protein
MNRIDPDITWFMSMTVDDMKLVRAVVEAARECVTDSYRPTPEYDRLRWDRLHEAVEALERAEKP